LGASPLNQATRGFTGMQGQINTRLRACEIKFPGMKQDVMLLAATVLLVSATYGMLSSSPNTSFPHPDGFAHLMFGKHNVYTWLATN
jgi:hypothetical protein